jgi:hypothetical protein
MRDYFSEHLIKKNVNAGDKYKKLIIIIVAVISATVVVQFFFAAANRNPDYNSAFMLLALIAAVAIAFFAYKKVLGLNVEYEYIYTEDMFDIDIIRNRAKRKHIFSIAVAEIEVMAHIDDVEHLVIYDDLPIKDYGSGEVLGNTYVFVATVNGKRNRFIIEPSDSMLNAFYKDLTPRRMFLKK